MSHYSNYNFCLELGIKQVGSQNAGCSRDGVCVHQGTDWGGLGLEVEEKHNDDDVTELMITCIEPISHSIIRDFFVITHLILTTSP